MPRHRFQFGLSTLLWIVVFMACNCWLCTRLYPWGLILAMTVDKHVLVAYLCMKFRVDRRAAAGPAAVVSR
jgi:hypothetical protein